ncbi:MAG: DUF2953 domain-containing protein [Eubacterium sp.]|nr:DUF2953 domain-containing protein [Eubacterium sp.]
MAIFLTVLKILGIVILCILGLVLLILLLVLFCPFRYTVGGEMYDEVRADASVRWLFIKVLVDYTKEKGLVYKLKLLGIPIYSSDKEPKEKKPEKEKDKEETGSEAGTEASLAGNEDGEKPAETGTELVVTPDSTELTYSDDEPYEEVMGTEEKKGLFDKPSTKDKIDGIINNITKKKDEFEVKMDHLDQFLDRPYVQRTIDRVKWALIVILKEIRPRSGKGYLHLGLEDPADTGELLGALSAFSWFIIGWLTFEPDFTKKVIEGDLHISGRIILGIIAGPLIRIAISRDFWKTYKLAKKI